jgi:beta-N-acetylhexosaminidase
MVGHIRNDQLDPDRPASLSAATVTGLLRDELGWDGVVVTDDLQAHAISQEYGADEAIALAIEAGVDLLLLANQQLYDADIVEHTIATIAGFVRIEAGSARRGWANPWTASRRCSRPSE